jgi:protein-disulfide isomerase
LKYAIIDLPLESIHGAAFRGAEMVRCAGEQGKYWEMRDRLFSNPQTIAQAASHAAAVGLDGARFDACLGSGKFAADIRKDMAQAEAAGVGGTPSFFLAVADPATGKLKPVRFMTGAQPFANFQAQIEAALAEQGAARPGGEKR